MCIRVACVYGRLYMLATWAPCMLVYIRVDVHVFMRNQVVYVHVVACRGIFVHVRPGCFYACEMRVGPL